MSTRILWSANNVAFNKLERMLFSLVVAIIDEVKLLTPEEA